MLKRILAWFSRSAEDRTTAPHIERIELRPGDRFVLHCDRVLDDPSCAALQAGWKRVMGADAPPLIILSPGLRLGVLHRGEAIAADRVVR